MSITDRAHFGAILADFCVLVAVVTFFVVRIVLAITADRGQSRNDLTARVAYLADTGAVGTAVGLVLTVIAFFDPVVDEPIATPGRLTDHRTIILVDVVSVVAGFMAIANDAVTATSVITSAQTSVGVDIVAIVALFDTSVGETVAAGVVGATYGYIAAAA